LDSQEVFHVKRFPNCRAADERDAAGRRAPGAARDVDLRAAGRNALRDAECATGQTRHAIGHRALFWDGQPVASIAALEPRFGRAAHAPDAPSISVEPDPGAPYERVAQVLAAAQRAGVTRLRVRPVVDR
jgi:Biopolymer transport protein ExbD/TolR